MLILSRLFRVGITGFALLVLSRIVPISIEEFMTGNACPKILGFPACYLVSVCYALMAIAAIFWNKRFTHLFFIGVTPVILLALTGTSLELLGHPTCPRSETGWPLCYSSLMAGLMMLAAFLIVLWFEKKNQQKMS
ncbi:MAG: hypothetical protein ABJN04_08805 [Hyphomicrobiales bacterium]